MDWEKKTAQRAPLKEAAADTFNEMLTPGQAFLQSLQSAEVVRKEAFFSTVSAKMKAAREKLPSLGVKHAPRSDFTIFTKAPKAEVHSLLPAIQPPKGDMSGVNQMLEAKLERHEHEWDTFQETQAAAKKKLEAAVAAAAAGLRERLATDDEDVESIMSVLDADQVMRLTEPEVHEVWDAVAQRIPERALWIEGLAAQLDQLEEQRKQTVESALVAMVQGMCEVAVLSEGEVERMLENEAQTLNKAILQNRCAYADLIKRLGVSEVEAERSRRERWEAALVSWRTLRSQHAMALFKQRIRSSEFAESPECLTIYEDIRGWQAATSRRLIEHVQSLTGLLPPHTTMRRATAWQEESTRLLAGWLASIVAWDQKLRNQDDHLEARGWQVYGQLVEEVLMYKGYPEEEARSLLDQECGTELRNRRETASSMYVQTKAFLEWQASTWRNLLTALAQWLCHLAAMFEDHKAVTAENETTVRATLKAKREEFNAQDAAAEAALEAAIEAVRQGSSEQSLDVLVAAALLKLDDVEAGYRQFAETMTAVVRTFPRTATEATERYHWQLCTHLLIKPLIGTDPTPPAPPPEPVTEPVPEPPPPTKPVTPPKGGKAAKQAAPPPPEPPPPPPEPEPEPEPEPIKSLPLSDGSKFDVMKDLLDLLQNKAEELAAAEEAAKAPPPETPAPEVPEVPATPPAPEPKAAAKGKPGKGGDAKQPEPAVVSPPVEVSPPAPTPPPAPTSPLTLAGRAHCTAMPWPAGTFRDVLEQMQVGLLREMVEFAARTSNTAEMWAEEREAALMEELDAHLRAHRPRAGRIEEETRLARSVELVAQRRRIEGHLRSQSKAVKAQSCQFEEWVADLLAVSGKQVTRLRGYDVFLGQALSVRSIDIRKREAEALRARIERDLDAKLVTLSAQVESSCARITSANAAFGSSELRTFDQGGLYNSSNVVQYNASLTAIDSHMQGAEQAQLAKLQECKMQILKEAGDAMNYIHDLIPSHHEDMQLIEQLDQRLEAARRKARTELGRNNQASAAIDEELDKLEAVLAAHGSKGTAAMTTQPRLARNSGSFRMRASLSHGRQLKSQNSVSSSTSSPSRSHLTQCKAILSSMDALRGLLFRQAKALDFLRSTGLTIEPVDLTLDASPSDEPEERQDDLDSSRGKAGGAMAFRPGARGAAGDGGSKAGGQGTASRPITPNPVPTIPIGNVVSLAADIEQVIDTCKQETQSTAQAYYQALFPEGAGKAGAKAGAAKPAAPATPPSPKGGSGKPATPLTDGPQPIRPIRYPSRIPPSINTLLAKTDEVLDGLREQLRQHVIDSMKRLRSQVIRAYRLVEHAPSVALSALAAHEMQAARKSQAGVCSKYRTRQMKLLAIIDKQRSALHPSMAKPSNRARLDGLKSSETERAAAFNQLIGTYTEEGVRGIEAVGPVIRTRLLHLVTVLVRLLDNFVMPDDLPPLRDDGSDDWVYALPGRKHGKQLFRLAAANAEAEGTPAEAAATAGKDGKGGKAGAGAKPPSAKGGKKGPGAAEGDASEPPRPFGVLTWTLPGGTLDLKSLGWTNDPALPQVQPAAGSRPPSAQQAPPSKGAPAKGGAAAQAAATASQPSVDLTVTALDTPCHRAGIRAYRASMSQIEEWLRGALSDLVEELSTWVKDEALWSRTWGVLMKQLEAI